MAKRSRAAKQAIENQDRGDDFAPPDRPDQISTGESSAEEIDIFAKDDQRSAADPGAGDDDHDIPPVREDDEPAPPVESRDKRERDADERPLQRAERSERRGSRDDDDDDGYSRRVKRRINREYALRVRAETRLKEERTARQQLEQRLARLERKQIDEQGQASLREIDAKIKEVSAKLAAAKEENDTAREVELQIELGELQGRKVRLEAKLEREREQRENATNDNDRGDDLDGPTRGRSADWVRAQRRWWSTTRWRDARTDAIAHDTTILQEIDDGELDFEPYSDEHFEELSHRLKADYPDLEIRTLDGDIFEPFDDDDDDYRGERMGNRRDDDRDDERRASSRRGNNRRRAPMGGLGGREGRRERSEVEMARRGKVTLTEEDFATMRIFKLDPSNPEHKKYYARERARTLLRSANNGATRR